MTSPKWTHTVPEQTPFASDAERRRFENAAAAIDRSPGESLEDWTKRVNAAVAEVGRGDSDKRASP